MQFCGIVFTKGQELVFRFINKNAQSEKTCILKLTVKHLEGANVNLDAKNVKLFSFWHNNYQKFRSNSGVYFQMQQSFLIKQKGLVSTWLGEAKGNFLQCFFEYNDSKKIIILGSLHSVHSSTRNGIFKRWELEA